MHTVFSYLKVIACAYCRVYVFNKSRKTDRRTGMQGGRRQDRVHGQTDRQVDGRIDR